MTSNEIAYYVGYFIGGILPWIVAGWIVASGIFVNVRWVWRKIRRAPRAS